MGIKQRWIVVNSKAAGERATKTMGRQTDRAKEKFDKDLFHHCSSKTELHSRVVNDYDLIFIGLLNRATTYAREHEKGQ